MVTYCTVEQVSEEMQLMNDEKISLDENAGSNYVEVANTEEHRWKAGQTVRLENEDGYSEDLEIQTVAYGTGATEHKITFTTNIGDNTKFSTADNPTIQILAFFTELTLPSYSTVERFILESEAEIEEICHQQWKETVWEGYLPFQPEIFPGPNEYSERYRITLPFPRMTTPLSSANGDEFKLWIGGGYIDCLDTGWAYGRTADYWDDGDKTLYIRKQRPRVGRNSVYLKARFGDRNVPITIRTGTIKMVVRRILKGNLKNIRKMVIPDEAGEAWPYNNGAPSYKEIKGIIEDHILDLFFGV